MPFCFKEFITFHKENAEHIYIGSELPEEYTESESRKMQNMDGIDMVSV